jgi:hypothetical protein
VKSTVILYSRWKEREGDGGIAIERDGKTDGGRQEGKKEEG